MATVPLLQRLDDAKLSPVFREQRQKNMKQRWAWGISIEELTVADLLKKAGYRTALVGKWHLGYDFKFHPMNQGFDEFRGYISGAVDYHSHVAQFGLKKLDWWKGKQVENEDGYTTDLLTQYATDFVVRFKGVPFFLYLAHEAPHTPLQGRVFYSAFGHDRHIFWNPVILRHYLAGIQFAFGDLAADATPSAQLPD